MVPNRSSYTIAINSTLTSLTNQKYSSFTDPPLIFALDLANKTSIWQWTPPEIIFINKSFKVGQTLSQPINFVFIHTTLANDSNLHNTNTYTLGFTSNESLTFTGIPVAYPSTNVSGLELFSLNITVGKIFLVNAVPAKTTIFLNYTFAPTIFNDQSQSLTSDFTFLMVGIAFFTILIIKKRKYVQ